MAAVIVLASLLVFTASFLAFSIVSTVNEEELISFYAVATAASAAVTLAY